MWMSAKEEICKTQIIYVVAKRMVAILFHGDRETNGKTQLVTRSMSVEINSSLI